MVTSGRPEGLPCPAEKAQWLLPPCELSELSTSILPSAQAHQPSSPATTRSLSSQLTSDDERLAPVFAPHSAGTGVSPANPDAHGYISFRISALACSYRAIAAKLRLASVHDLLLETAREQRAWRDRNSKLAVFLLRHEYNITPQGVLEQASTSCTASASCRLLCPAPAVLPSLLDLGILAAPREPHRWLKNVKML